jgi:hypothetical protein
MDGVRLYATRGGIPLPKLKQETYYQIPYSIVDLPEANSLKRKRDVLTRFLHILNLLVSVYKIPKTSLHVFADEEGKFVAFNRNGSLFVNLRYYEAWRTS